MRKLGFENGLIFVVSVDRRIILCQCVEVVNRRFGFLE
jgi:hypothetical protein